MAFQVSVGTAASDQPLHGWQARIPPISALVLGLAIALLVVHVALSAVGTDLGSWVPALDLAIVAGAGTLGFTLRRSLEGTTRGERLALWEERFATKSAAIVLALLAVAGLLWAILAARSPGWLGWLTAALITAVLAAVISGPRPTAEPGDVIPEGEQPDDPDAFDRIELPWSLDPNLPDVKGTIGLWIKKETVAEFRSTNPGTKWDGSLPRMDWYVEQGQCPEINTLADRLAAVSRRHGLTRYLELLLVLDLVQKTPYKTDIATKGVEDYWRFPLETLADGCGDCEDTAILAVSLLSALGHRTCFFLLPGHAAMGVAGLPEETGVCFDAADGQHFYYVETTADGFTIGELPEGVVPADVRVATQVAPLRGRRQDRLIRPVPDGQWREHSMVLVRGALVLAVAGAAIGYTLNWLWGA